jgi:hypothetical protein
MTAHKVKVKTMNEFNKLIAEQNYDISKAIVERLLININTKRRFIHVLEVEIKDENDIYDFKVDRKEMISTLEENLKIYEKNENYEGCDNILKAIESLKKTSHI